MKKLPAIDKDLSVSEDEASDKVFILFKEPNREILSGVAFEGDRDPGENVTKGRKECVVDHTAGK